MTTTMLILEKENIAIDVDLQINDRKELIKIVSGKPEGFMVGTVVVKFTVMINGRLKRTEFRTIVSHHEENGGVSSEDLSIEYDGKSHLFHWDYSAAGHVLQLFKDFGYIDFETFNTRNIGTTIESGLDSALNGYSQPY